MNEEIIEEIYNKLVERFGIGDVFLPKHGKRKATITWKEFIKAALALRAEELYKFCFYNSARSFSRGVKSYHILIIEDKKAKQWFRYFCDLNTKKRCSKCGRVLPSINFSKNPSQKGDGLHNHCKYCTNKYQKVFYIENKYLFNARNAKRRAIKLKATPNWADLVAIKEIYRTCPEGYHVDHIVPLQGKLVCGLHCEFNLQYLSATENRCKANKFEID
jgi:hypothetical protein